MHDFARPSPGDSFIRKKIVERNLRLALARDGYKHHTLDAHVVVDLVRDARDYHRTVMWALAKRREKGQPYINELGLRGVPERRG